MYQLRKKPNNNKSKVEKTKTRENSIKMAKSLRSKWKRKMKAEKRVKYGEREDKRLIKMLEAAEELKKQDGQDAVMMTNEPKDDEKETVRNRGKDREKNQETRASEENSEKSDKIESQASQEKMIKCESFAEKLPTCYRSSLRQARFVKREKFGGNVEVF